MNLLYNFGIRLYQGGVKLASLRNPKARKMIEGQQQTLRKLAAAFPEGGGQPVWFHAASLGEFEQARPLIERLRREQPDQKILLTFFSPSGYEVRKDYAGADCVCYLPFDTPLNVELFLDVAQPSMAIFVKYEFWGNYLEQLQERGIPVYIISAIFRQSQMFFKWWGKSFRDMLQCYDHLYVQDRGSAELLASIGITNVDVAGDTRFDRVTDILRTAPDIPAMNRFRNSAPMVLVAGSSWQPDEEVYIPWANSRDDVRMIIAPHEFDEQRLRKIENMIDGTTVRLSQLERDPALGDGVKCILVDCFGKLAALYRYGDIAYIGGGFGAGIHNINEAAVYGIPVVFGPNHSKFKEATDLIERGGGYGINGVENGRTVLSRLADNSELLQESGRRAGQYISSSIGATRRIYSQLWPGD